MANDKNLTNIAERAPDEARAIRSNGGKKSGETRRKKRDTKALYRKILSMAVKTNTDMRATLRKIGYEVKEQGDPTVEEVIGMVIAAQAMQGDIASARYINDYAQNPDMRTQLERERIKAIAQKGAKLDVTLNAEDSGVMGEIRRRMAEATLEAPETL